MNAANAAFVLLAGLGVYGAAEFAAVIVRSLRQAAYERRIINTNPWNDPRDVTAQFRRILDSERL